MPKQKDLKRRVRSRMRKTGESYTTARSQVVAKRRPTPAPAADLAALAGMSDAAVQAKTGHGWTHWVAVLDAAGAAALPHRDIARHLNEVLGVPGWWSQMITVGYERIRGLRAKGQRRGGGYDVGKTKTFAVPLRRLYAAFGERRRREWLGAQKLRVKKATPQKSIRIAWGDGTPVEVYFEAKGPAKSRVSVQHRQLATKAEAERVRAFWGERLAQLAVLLAEPR